MVNNQLPEYLIFFLTKGTLYDSIESIESTGAIDSIEQYECLIKKRRVNGIP
jgi:hypothetical protein